MKEEREEEEKEKEKESSEAEQGKKKWRMKQREKVLSLEKELAHNARFVDREKLDKWDPEARPLYSRGHAVEGVMADQINWKFRMSYLFGTLVERLWDGDPDISALSDKKRKEELLTEAERVVARLWLVENLNIHETAYLLRRRESWVLSVSDRILGKLVRYLGKI